MQKGDKTEQEPRGESRNIGDCEETEARGRQVTQGIHSSAAIMVSFLRLTLQMSCGNLSYKSQLKLTTKPVVVPGPSKLSLETIAAPPGSGKPSLTIMLKESSSNYFC